MAERLIDRENESVQKPKTFCRAEAVQRESFYI
jgi:hypothetical protein